jgi:hypothetical protein
LGSIEVKPGGALEVWISDECYGGDLSKETALALAKAIFKAQRVENEAREAQDFFDSCFATGIDRSVAERAWEELKCRSRLSPKGPMATAAEGRPANFNELTEEQRWEIDKRLGILDWDESPET